MSILKYTKKSLKVRYINIKLKKKKKKYMNHRYFFLSFIFNLTAITTENSIKPFGVNKKKELKLSNEY